MAEDRWVFGVDPGLASFGYSVIEVHKVTAMIVEMGVIRTKKSDLKHGVLSADDNVRRLRELYATFHPVLLKYPPIALCAESMSYPRNSSAAAKLGMSWGVIVAAAEAAEVPIFQAAPQRVREHLISSRAGSKDKIQAALKEKYPEADFEELLSEVAGGEQEHAWDALAVATVCMDSSQIRAFRKMLK